MDEYKEPSIFTETVNTPKCGLVSFEQVVTIANEAQACIMRKAGSLSVALALKVVKGDASHSYKSIAGFERNYSKFDGFSQFDLLVSLKYENDADGPITRMGIHRIQNLQIGIDAAGYDEELVTACAKEFRNWLDDYINESITVSINRPVASLIPEIPVFRSALSDEDDDPSLKAGPTRKLIDLEEPGEKTFWEKNKLEIILVSIGSFCILVLLYYLLRR